MEHLARLSTAGVDAFKAGDRDAAQALLEAVEAEMSEAGRQIGAGHEMNRLSAMRFSDAAMGLDELLPQLSKLAALVDGDDIDVAS